MPGVGALAEQRARQQKALAKATAEAARKEWAAVDPNNIAESWATGAARATVVVAGAQLTAASGSQDYVNSVVSAQGYGASDYSVVPQAFAGYASDGRALSSLLYEPVYRALQGIGAGLSPDAALSAGAVLLDMIARTQVADAGRLADGAAIAATPKVGYVRMLVGESCSRCILLAGKFYRWNAGFKRHPRCDCRHVPCAENASGDLRTDPKAYFVSLSESEQNRVFTAAGAQAIRDGADINQVVNARRGLYTAGGRSYTSSSTTRRGVSRGDRLTTEQIYREANGNRSEAIRLLRRFGYLR